MNLLIAYYLAIFSHFIFDFVWQTKDISKKRMLNQPMLVHCLIMGVSSAIIIGFYYQSLIIFVQSSLIIFVTHLLIDMIRVELDSKLPKNSPKFWQYLGADQILHTLVILVIFLILQ